MCGCVKNCCSWHPGLEVPWMLSLVVMCQLDSWCMRYLVSTTGLAAAASVESHSYIMMRNNYIHLSTTDLCFWATIWQTNRSGPAKIKLWWQCMKSIINLKHEISHQACIMNTTFSQVLQCEYCCQKSRLSMVAFKRDHPSAVLRMILAWLRIGILSGLRNQAVKFSCKYSSIQMQCRKMQPLLIYLWWKQQLGCFISSNAMTFDMHVYWLWIAVAGNICIALRAEVSFDFLLLCVLSSGLWEYQI